MTGKHRAPLSTEEVVTEVLDFFPVTGSPLQDVLDFADTHNVRVELQGNIRGPGGYPVRYRGTFENVFRMLSIEYCANEVPGSTSKYLYILGLMGDKNAMRLWDDGDFGSPVKKRPTYDDYNWPAHWLRVGVVSGERYPDNDAQVEAAIEMLFTAGYSIMDEEDNPDAFEAIDFAQTYLMLAFHHCPRLMEVTPRVTSQHSAS